MLDSLRKGSKSWIAKGLLILLVLSFGVWGIADYIVSGGGPKPAITVGDQAFAAETVRDRFSQDVSRLRREGLDLTVEQALSVGVLGQTVQRMVEGAVLDQTAGRLGLAVSDARLREAIQSDPMFQGEDGRFDRDRLNALLAANGMTEEAYVALVRQDMLRRMVMGPIATAAAAPPTASDLLASYASERRVARVLRIPDAAMTPPAPATATDAVLQEVYEANIARFTAPERRGAVTLVLTVETIQDRVTVPEEEIRAAYYAAPESYTAPATRSVTQALFPTRAAAEDARNLVVDQGHSLDAAARAITGSGALELGAITGDSLPPPLPEMIFAQPLQTLSEPVETSFGWHLFLVTEATEAGPRPFDAVREEIRQELVGDLALDAVYALSTEVEDALAGGATLEEAAGQVDIPLKTVVLDRQGRGPDGDPVADLPPSPDFLTDLFALTEGETGFMTEFTNGFFITRLDDITPAAPQPLDDVRDAVVALWQADRQAAAALDTAQSLLDRAKAGVDLARLAEEIPGASVTDTPPVTRDAAASGSDDASGLPAPLVSALFAAEAGQPSVVDLPAGAALFAVTDIRQPPPPTAETERDRVAAALRQGYAADVSQHMVEALSRRLGVEIEQSVILSAIRPD